MFFWWTSNLLDIRGLVPFLRIITRKRQLSLLKSNHIISHDNSKERGINKDAHTSYGENVNMGTTERLVFTIIFGFAVIFNLIGSSYLEFYPITLLIGVAFAVGISMVIGTGYLLIKEPEKFVKIKHHNTVRVDSPLARRRANVASC